MMLMGRRSRAAAGLCVFRSVRLAPTLKLNDAQPQSQRSPGICVNANGSFSPLLLPLYNPLAMRVAMEHVLGEFEGKIGV